MQLAGDFSTFLQEIRPTESQRSDCKTGHTTLRERLRVYEDLSPILVTDFLQGSYRRATAVRPKGDRRSDVDIIVVTKLHEDEYSPNDAMALFEPFLDKHYKGKWKRQGRSFGIELSYVDLDLVITSAPSESQIGILESDAVRSDEDLSEANDWALNKSWIPVGARVLSEDVIRRIAAAKTEPEWKTEPLRIPDREANKWQSTHPIEQIRWTRSKNSATDGHFGNVVKAIKWWRLEKFEIPKHPKGFPLERLIGDCCPDVSSVAEGITTTLEQIVTKYAEYVRLKLKPSLPDYGVPEHDVFAKITADDFAAFYKQVETGAALARRALDEPDRAESGRLWRELLGTKFPEPPKTSSGKAAFSTPTGPADPGPGRFA